MKERKKSGIFSYILRKLLIIRNKRKSFDVNIRRNARFTEANGLFLICRPMKCFIIYIKYDIIYSL